MQERQGSGIMGGSGRRVDMGGQAKGGAEHLGLAAVVDGAGEQQQGKRRESNDPVVGSTRMQGRHTGTREQRRVGQWCQPSLSTCPLSVPFPGAANHHASYLGGVLGWWVVGGVRRGERRVRTAVAQVDGLATVQVACAGEERQGRRQRKPWGQRLVSDCGTSSYRQPLGTPSITL